jgi:regulator of sigma E protease
MSPIDHLLGLVPVMMVADEEVAQGLERGDIFARIGAVEFPNLAQGMAEIKGYARRELDLEVLRAGPSGDGLVRVKLKVKVNGKGQIGFRATHTGERGTWVSLPPRELTEIRDKASPRVPAAMTLIDKPGTKVVRVGDRDVASFGAMREALQRAILAAMDGGVSSENAGIAISVTLDLPGEVQTRRDVVWNIPAMDAKEILALGYGPSVSTGIFEPEEFLQVARTPGEALGKGLHETKRVMITTYITFARLFEGTVKIEHLKGPVGIAHLGTMIADRGVIWLVFFMALISVNLAVVNFLPLPIVDGGQFLFILFEAIRGRPVPIRIQSIATFMGLAMIGCMFLLVTFNDLKRLIGM